MDVALATYNGERYLPELLASIAVQEWPELAVMVCDDRSSDATRSILAGTDDLVVQVVVNDQNLGARGNFSKTLSLTRAPYVVLADQDDVWLPGKLDRMMARMLELEEATGAGRPALVFSDLRIVDQLLNPMAGSFFDGSYKSREAARVEDFVISNHVPGCATMVNRALLDMALPVPRQAYMHDWWLCLVAAACGGVGHVPDPLILFRRHGMNASGDGRPKARGGWVDKAVQRLREPMRHARVHVRWIEERAREANTHLSLLRSLCGDHLWPDAAQRVQALLDRRWWRRARALRHAHVGESRHDALLIAWRMGARVNRYQVEAETGHKAGDRS